MRSSHHLAWWRVFILCLCCCVVVVVNGIASPNNTNNKEEEEDQEEVPRCFHANAKGRRATNEDETLCATIEAPRELEEEGGERMGVGKKQFLVAAVFDGHDGRFVSSQARKLVAESVEGRLFEKEEGRFKKDEDYSAKGEMSTTGDDDGNVEMEERRERRALEMALRDVHETIERKMTDGANPDASVGDGLRV